MAKIQEGMTRKGEKRSPESVRKQAEAVRKTCREKKTARQIAEELLYADYNGKTVIEALIEGIQKGGLEGDLKKADYILKLIEQAPKEKQSIDVNIPFGRIEIVSNLESDEEDNN